MHDPASHTPQVKSLGPAQPVPVFNCLVIVSPRGSDGLVLARTAEVAGIEGRAKTEPEALKLVVAAFKKWIAVATASGEPIPWLTGADKLIPGPGDQQRFIAVHL